MRIMGSLRSTIKHKQYKLGFAWILLELLQLPVLLLALPFAVLHYILDNLAIGTRIFMQVIFGNAMVYIEKGQEHCNSQFRQRVKAKQD